MDGDSRIIEILSEMLIEQKQTNVRLGRVEMRLEQLEEQQAKTNLAIGELQPSVMKLADKFEMIADHERRIDKLEHTVYHQS